MSEPSNRAVSIRYLSSFAIGVLLTISTTGLSLYALSGAVDTKDPATVGLISLIVTGLISALMFTLKAHHEIMTGRKIEDENQQGRD